MNNGGCSEKVWRSHSFNSSPCLRKGVIKEDGLLWCKQHAPSAKRKRYDEAQAKHDAESAIRSRDFKLKLAARIAATKAEEMGYDGQKAIEALPELLGSMRFILAFYEPGQTHLDTEAWKVAEASARAAIAKAKGDPQ